MQYLGGKFRTAEKIAAYIHAVMEPGQKYYEPFCGACWVTVRIKAPFRYASDANASMIAFWKAIQDGWEPPDSVSREEHAAAKRGEYADRPHLEAFIMVGCSFGGDWGAGYARDNPSHSSYFARAAKRGSLDKMLYLTDVCFAAHDYRDLQPEPKSLIYCDPPYEGMTGYDAVGAFDSAAFWQWAQDMTLDGHTVVVSEYTAPPGWACVMEESTKTALRGERGSGINRIEKLFRFGDYDVLQPKLF